MGKTTQTVAHRGPQRDSRGRFIKGNKISGRPPGVKNKRTLMADDLAKYLREEKADELAKVVDNMLRLAKSGHDKQATQAARILLEYAYGRAPQTVLMGNVDDDPLTMQLNVYDGLEQFAPED